MKAETHRNGAARNSVAAKRVTVKGKRMVMLAEADFDRLMRKADEWEPLLPEADAEGNRPALEYLQASLALKIIRHRRKLGLTQADLARRAGIRPEVLNRIEQSHVAPTVRTIEKIDRALQDAEKEATGSNDG
jgi:ribosome-binding protein aMBF1 (putative translation factor)